MDMLWTNEALRITTFLMAIGVSREDSELLEGIPTHRISPGPEFHGLTSPPLFVLWQLAED